MVAEQKMEKLTVTYVALPFITTDLPGIGGEIKHKPAHFVVEEIPLYEPIGEGEHVYVCLIREGWNTRTLQKRLAHLFGLRARDVGYAGLKDKQARVTQTFSLFLPDHDEATIIRRIQEALPVRVLWAKRHRNKLKMGHLLGNRFRIVVFSPVPAAISIAYEIALALQKRGFPNYYGLQRFGIHGDNAQRGWEILQGQGTGDRWLRQLFLSAYQAALFNAWLVKRIHFGWFDQLLTGDIAKKFDTGGLFPVLDAAKEILRFQQQEITYTGPVYGYRMLWAQGKAGDLERQVLEDAGVTPDMFRNVRLDGGRRPARLFLHDFSMEPHPHGIILSFTLRKGTYATVVLREFLKTEFVFKEEEK